MTEQLKRFGNLIIAITLGLILLAIGVAIPSQYAEAATNAAPTPPANVVVSNKTAGDVTFLASTATTTSLTTAKQELAQANTMSVQYVFATTNNTATITLQVSNDGTNWVNSDVIASAVQSGTGMNVIPIISRYQRFSVTLSSAVTATVSIVALTK